MALARLLRRFADPPGVVFLTGHPDAAVEAFEVQALDFIVKPVGRDRLEAALDRVEQHAGSKERPGAPRAAARTPPASSSAPDVVAVDNPKGGGKRLVRAREHPGRPGQRRLRAHPRARGALPPAHAAQPAREGLGRVGLRARASRLSREPRPRRRAARPVERHRGPRHARRRGDPRRAPQRRRPAAAPERLAGVVRPGRLGSRRSASRAIRAATSTRKAAKASSTRPLGQDVGERHARRRTPGTASTPRTHAVAQPQVAVALPGARRRRAATGTIASSEVASASTWERPDEEHERRGRTARRRPRRAARRRRPPPKPIGERLDHRSHEGRRRLASSKAAKSERDRSAGQALLQPGAERARRRRRGGRRAAPSPTWTLP